LTWKTTNDNIDMAEGFNLLSGNSGHVAKVGHVWIVMRQHGAGEQINLRYADAFPSKPMPRHGCGLDA